MEKGLGDRDDSATEPRKVGNDTKPRKTQQIRKRQVCQAGRQEQRFEYKTSSLLSRVVVVREAKGRGKQNQHVQ